METPMIDLYRGECLATLRNLPDNSVDSIVTDPPYGLSNTDPAKVQKALTAWVMGARDYVPEGKGFMGQSWDSFVPPPAVWDECYRVLKPGGHVAVFAGSRTQDLMGLSIRLAGFDVRDSVAWLYGSGFPKSLDVSKAIDKAGHLSRERALEFTAWMKTTGITAKEIDEATATVMGSRFLTDGVHPRVASAHHFDLLRPHLPEVPERIERLVAERTGLSWSDYQAREVIGTKKSGIAVPGEGPRHTVGGGSTVTVDVTTSATDEARKWEGWGTALKPAHEPIILARKPFHGTVAANVQKHGTGALNIDATRIPANGELSDQVAGGERVMTNEVYGKGLGVSSGRSADLDGRWPANVILDEDQAAALDEQSGTSRSVGGSRGAGGQHGTYSPYGAQPDVKPGYGDEGGASRFFYVAKAGKKERPSYVDEDGKTVAHPTVKPVALMRWLVRLITPPGGTVLEPFAGTGTTGEAAALEGFACIMIERHEPYLPLIRARMDRVAKAEK